MTFNLFITLITFIHDHQLIPGPDHHPSMPVWQFMPPADFCRFSIPFEMEGITRDIPGGLPQRFHKACIHREQLVEQWQKNVKDAGLNRQQRKQFQNIVEERFQVGFLVSYHKYLIFYMVYYVYTSILCGINTDILNSKYSSVVEC